MTFMDPDGSPAEEPEVENYDDFTNPTNLLRAPSWISASPDARPKLVDRAMNAFLTELEGKRDKVVDSVDAKGEAIQAPVWSPAGTLTGKGMEYVEKTRQLLQTAAQDPEGGIYMDDYSGKWETSAWVDNFTKAQPKPKAFDPLGELDDWRKETSALGDETNLAAQSWEGYVEHANANITDEAAKIDPDSKELKKEWSRRMALADFQPGQMGDTIIEKVGGQHIINPDFYAQIDKVEESIDALKIPESEKRLMRLQHRDNVEKNASTLVNAFSAADAGVLGSIVSRPLNDEFNEAMSKPGASAYEFIKANKERFNKDNYGVGQEVAETFRDALMATGTGALWVGSGGQLTAPMEAWGGLAADSGKAYNNTTQFTIGGIDINRRDLTELTGQIGSFIAMGGAGMLAGKGLVKAGVDKGSRYGATAVAARATAKVTEDTALAATKTFGEKAVSLGKALATDPEMILGSLQAAGMSYGRTFNDEMELTGSRDEAHKKATIQGVANGLGAMIATGAMNRLAPGAGKLLGMSDQGGIGVVQQIRSRYSGAKGMKLVQETLDNLKKMPDELRKPVAAGLVASMNESAQKLGLRGLGVVGDVVAEGVEESMDEVISDAIVAMSDDSKSWSEAEWENIQNNWEGYVKAGILGAIGGTAGGAQNAALNPRQVFGKSVALDQQEGLWKKIKANVKRFDSPMMAAMTGKKSDNVSVAEYLASDKPSIQDKSQVLIATARQFYGAEQLADNLQGARKFTAGLNPLPEASTPTSGTESRPEAQDGSLAVAIGQEQVSSKSIVPATAKKGSASGNADFDKAFPQEEMEFDEESHSYFVAGQKLPSVTERKGSHPMFAFNADEAAEAASRGRNPKYSGLSPTQIKGMWEADSKLGSAIHNDVSKALTDPSHVPSPEVASIVKTIREFADGPIVSEKVVWMNGVAGTIDMLVKTKSGKYMLVDFKTMGSNPHTDGKYDQGFKSKSKESESKGEGYRVQMAAYKAMLKSKGIEVTRSLVVPIDRETGKVFKSPEGRATIVADSNSKTDAYVKEIFPEFFINPEANPAAPSRPSIAPVVEAPGGAAAAVTKEGTPEATAAETPLATAKKEEAPAADTLSKDEELTATAVKSDSTSKPSVAPAPKVAQGSKTASHTPEVVDGEETGLWISRDSKVTVEPRLLRELMETHDDDSGLIAADIDARVENMKNAHSGIQTLDAAAVSDKKYEGAAIDAIDPEGALIVASDTIEQSQTDEAGGKWERVNMQEKSEQTRDGENAVNDGLGEKIVYTYKAPKGQTLSVRVNQVVLIQGEPDSVLVLDEVKDGKWVFRKADVSPESLRLDTMSQKVRNILYNRIRLVEQSKQAKALVPAIANGSVTIPQIRALFNSVMDGVAPNFKGKVVEVDMSKDGASYLRANLQTGQIEVDFKKLKEQLRQQYTGVNTSSDLANEVLAADVARVLAYFVDEETLHLLTKDVFENGELEGLYKDIAKNPEHPFHKLLVETAAERYPGRSVDPKEKDKAKGLKFVGGADYVVAAELIRKLHQLRWSGSYTERAVRQESQWLQGSINMDADETGKIGKLVNTVAALVKRYSDRIKNILGMRWAIGQLPQHQRQMLFRLDQAYRQAGVQGDVNFGQEDALQSSLEMQREGTEAHLKWGNKITGEHFQAMNELRQIVDQFQYTKFENVFDIDGETFAMSLKPVVKDYLEKHVAEFAPDSNGNSAAMQRIEALLGAINDEKSDLSAGQTGFERAKTLVFLNRQVMEAEFENMDLDVTDIFEFGSPSDANILSQISKRITPKDPKEVHAAHVSWINRQIRNTEGRMNFIRDITAMERLDKIGLMDHKTSAGRLHILAEAKRLGLDNPFLKDGIKSEDVNGISQALKERVIERARNLQNHSSYVVPIASSQFEYKSGTTNLKTLQNELVEWRKLLSKAESDFLNAPPEADLTQTPSWGVSKFIRFNQALKKYNDSVQNLQYLAFGDVWKRPKEFGLGMRDLNRESRERRGEKLSFPISISSPSSLENNRAPSVAPSTSKDDTFGVRFEDSGLYLGFRPKLHWFEEGKGMEPLTLDEVMDNQERAVLEIAGNSNAAYVGRMQWLQFFVDWVDGQITDTKGADIYYHTGGFALPKDTNSEIGADRYRAANAFRSADVKLFNHLVFEASNEAKKLSEGKGNEITKKQLARKELLEHLEKMEAWAKETLALVNQPKEDVAIGFAPLITELGGKQTLSGRVKGLIESQFAHKDFRREFDENGNLLPPGRRNDSIKEAQGLITLIGNMRKVVGGDSHAAVHSELTGAGIAEFRARLDGANDASRLTNKALESFLNQEWRNNVAYEGSRWQREASFVGDNTELERLRNAPIDARILSNLSWLLKFHEKQRDYVFGSNFAFELLETINRSNRGEGRMPEIYDKAGNITNPNVFEDDKRTNRAENIYSMMESLDVDRSKTAAEVAIDQAASPENQRRMALTTAALMIGSQSNGDTLDIDAGRTFLFDLWAMENGHKSRDEQRQLIRQGVRGVFPKVRTLRDPEAFYDEMMKELSELLPDIRMEGKVGISAANAPSVETVLVRLLELKQSFEATIVEEAKAGHKIGRALAAVKLAAVGASTINTTDQMLGMAEPTRSGFSEVLKEIEDEIDVPNPARQTGQGDDFFSLIDGKKQSVEEIPKTVKKRVTKTVRVKITQANSFANPDEAEGIARMIKGEMLRNSESSKDPVTKVRTNSEALNVYDATMLIHGIDGIGNSILSQLIQTLPGETLVVSPKDAQVTRYGLDDVGLKIIPGVDGGPNVVYAPQSQKNPEKNATESFGGIAQALKMASKSEAVREQVAEMARIIRLSLDPAVFSDSIAADPTGHLSDVAELGRLLRLDGDGGALINMFGDDQSNASDILIVAEVLTNPKAKELFDKVYVGVDGFANTLLAEPVELALQDGIRNILRADTGAQEHDQDHVDRATEDSVTLDEEQEVDGYNWYDTTPDAPEIEALAQAKTFEELQEMLEGRARSDREADQGRKANRFGPDAARINKRLANELGGNGLNPSDAFLFNGLARILEQGKAANGAPELTASDERSTSDILNNPLDPTGQGITTDARRLAIAGPALMGNVEPGIKAAAKMYVGEMRNLTIPKANGRTAQNIAFQKRNIDSTNSSLLLRAPLVRSLVGEVVRKKALQNILKQPDSSGFGRVDVALPLDDAMMASIASALPEGVLDAALEEVKLSIETLEKNETRLTGLREALLAEIGAFEADNGQAFQELLDNSPEGENLLATAKDWSESLKAETRDMVVAHVTRFAVSPPPVVAPALDPDEQELIDAVAETNRKPTPLSPLQEAVESSANLGHVVHSMLTVGMENNPQLKAATDGLYKQANAIGALVRERNALLTPDENNELPQGDTQGINSRISDAARLFNLHASIFNSHAEMHARQVMRWTGLDHNVLLNPKTANLSKFRVKGFKDTDNVAGRDLAAANNELSAMLNGQKFASGFLDNMVREITQGVTTGAKPKTQTNDFMRMVAAELQADPALDLPAFIDEKLNEMLNEDAVFYDAEQQQPANFKAALTEIAMATNEARYILSSKARSSEQEEGRKQAAIYLGRVERELDQTRKELAIIDSNEGSVPVGMGYYSDRVSQGVRNDSSGKVVSSAIDKGITMGARLTLSNPAPEPDSDATGTPTSASSDTAGTMSRRDYWTRQKAVITALTEQSENRIEDAYRFVRGSRDQFMNFDPLKAINQAVDLVNLEEQITKEVMQDARSDAQEAKYKGLTADAAAYLADPEEALTFTRTAQNRVKQINLPKSHQLRKEKLGVLINQDGEKVVMLPINARELLMERFPKITKRNVNREMERIILDALPVNQPSGAQGSYSYFLNGTKDEEPKPFDGSDFSQTKTGLTKGAAAKAFETDFRAGVQKWMDDAMSSVTGVRRTAKLDGPVSETAISAQAYNITRLVIAHGDDRLSDGTKAKIRTLLKSIDSGEFAQVGGTAKDMDVSQMLAFRVQPVFSLAFSEIEAIAIQEKLITDFVSFDGKKHALELGALKFLHHQDARIRSKFRRNYAARQAAIHLQDFIEYGIDGTSGRQGYETAKKAEEEKIVAAAKPIGNNAKDQTIGYLISVFRGIDTAFGMHRETATNRLVEDIRRGLNELENLNAAQAKYFGTGKSGAKNIIPTLNRYWNADNLDMIRDLELAREVRGWMLESGIANTIISSPEVAKRETDKFIALLQSKVTPGNETAVEGYANQLNASFADISNAMQLTMAMLSQNKAVDKQPDDLLKGERMITGEAWRDDAKEAFKRTYSSVPLRVGYAARPDPKDQQVSSDRFIADPIDMVSLKDSSFFGGYGKGGYFNSRNPFRPISLNGLTAPLTLLDDAIYKLNVTPTYEVLRRSLGRVVQDEHGVNTIKDGDMLNKVNSIIPDDIDWNDPAQSKAKQKADDDVKKFRQALSAISEENETILQNDAANGVSNTGGAETMRFLGSLYIVRALASVQQVWNQTSGPSVGYAAGKIAVGKGKQAAQYFSILQRLIVDRKFNEDAREFVRKTDRSVYYRSADGADVARDIMHSQVRFGKSKAKNLAGKGLREYEKLGEKALHWTIGKGESYLSTAMFIVELADQMKMKPEDVIKPGVEPTAMAKSNARRKVNDVMAQSDQSKKSWMFQNRTSSPGRNALWRSMVRFSNHTSSVASNTSVLVPVLFDSQADPETKKEALENVVTSLTQNILFYPFKLQMLVPMVAYLFFLAGGDDDDKAQRKAQELANKALFVDDDSSMLGEVIKTITMGKKKELFDQTKKADAAQASAFAEIASKSLVEFATAIPVLGVMVGYAPVSGLVQKSVTNPMAIAGAAGVNNTFNRRKLKPGFNGYDKNGVTIREFSDSWHGTLADLTAPTAMAHDAMEAGILTSQYLMSREAQRNRAASLLDAATYLTFEAIPFAREPRSVKRAELREVVRKDSKRK